MVSRRPTVVQPYVTPDGTAPETNPEDRPLTPAQRASNANLMRREFSRVQSAMYAGLAAYFRDIAAGQGLNPDYVVKPDKFNRNVEGLGSGGGKTPQQPPVTEYDAIRGADGKFKLVPRRK